MSMGEGYFVPGRGEKAPKRVLRNAPGFLRKWGGLIAPIRVCEGVERSNFAGIGRKFYVYAHSVRVCDQAAYCQTTDER